MKEKMVKNGLCAYQRSEKKFKDLSGYIWECLSFEWQKKSPSIFGTIICYS